MNLRVVSRNVGFALLVSALFMFLSVIVSLVNGQDSALQALGISFAITLVVGLFPFIFVRGGETITLKDGYMIIVLSWVLSFIFGSLPYLLWGGPFTIANAWFESVSGFTTTGATILENIEELPKSLLFWRSSTHFIGGLGVVVFLLMIIPNGSPVRLRLTNMEISSMSRDGYRSGAGGTVRIFATVYLVLNAAAILAYYLAGMSFFDAVNHGFSVGATGGFSTHNESIGFFNSTSVNIITIVFMILSSVHFGMLYITFVTRSLRPLHNPVLRYYLLSLLTMSVISAISLKLNGVYGSWSDAFMDGTFHVVSYASTTGFAIADNAAWPMLPCFILILMSIQCGCAGSTTGGLKCDRILILWKSVRRHVRLALHPSSVKEVRLGRVSLPDDEIFPFILYIAMYFFLMALSVIVCLVVGDNNSEALTGTLASLGNIGPALGDIGSMGNFNHLTVTSKVMFSLDMFLGRVEIYPVLAVISLMFHRKQR